MGSTAWWFSTPAQIDAPAAIKPLITLIYGQCVSEAPGGLLCWFQKKLGCFCVFLFGRSWGLQALCCWQGVQGAERLEFSILKGDTDPCTVMGGGRWWEMAQGVQVATWLGWAGVWHRAAAWCWHSLISAGPPAPRELQSLC